MLLLFFALAMIALSGCGPHSQRPSSGASEILFLGDTAFGENYQQRTSKNILKEKGYEHGFEWYAPILGIADVAIANLETPLVFPDQAEPQNGKPYIHWSDPKIAPAVLAEHGITHVSLANNHTLDYGEAGLASTLTALQQHGITAFGAGIDRHSAQLPVTIPLANGKSLFVFGGFQYSRTYDQKYHFYAGAEEAGTARLASADFLDNIAQYRDQNPEGLIVVFPHWGKNYQTVDAAQSTLASQLFSAGADLIIGHGAHILQRGDHQDGKFILYGLGNFVFNSPGRYQKLDAEPFSAILRLSVVEENTIRIRIYPTITDNLTTGYQGRFVNETEYIRTRSLLPGTPGKDRFGRYSQIMYSLQPSGRAQY